jgi:hypothetical protein
MISGPVPVSTRVPTLKESQGYDPGARALFSECERYRYQLERFIGPPFVPSPRRFVACGLNPSVADAFKLDPTCRREIDFARSAGCGLYVKVNAYAWRATVPREMFSARERGHHIDGERLSNRAVDLGNTNDAVVRSALTMLRRDGGVAVACWGEKAEPDRVQRLVAIAREVGVEWQCFGVNKDGSPKHPLYLPRDTQLTPWSEADQMRNQSKHTRRRKR